jgi:hypothetical protein
VINKDHPLTQGLNAHKEFEELKGYSLEGARVGQGVIHSAPPSKTGAWHETFYHRLPFLKPQLTAVGIGDYREGKNSATLADIWTFTDGEAYKAVVYYPEDKQTKVPIHFGHEIPDPIPESHRGRPAGFPITVHFTQDQKLTKADLKLFDDKGNAVPCHLSSPEAPAIMTYPVWVQANTICAIPVEPLAPATTYRAELRCQVNGKPMTRTWQFSTRDSP